MRCIDWFTDGSLRERRAIRVRLSQEPLQEAEEFGFSAVVHGTHWSVRPLKRVLRLKHSRCGRTARVSSVLQNRPLPAVINTRFIILFTVSERRKCLCRNYASTTPFFCVRNSYRTNGTTLSAAGVFVLRPVVLSVDWMSYIAARLLRRSRRLLARLGAPNRAAGPKRSGPQISQRLFAGIPIALATSLTALSFGLEFIGHEC